MKNNENLLELEFGLYKMGVIFAGISSIIVYLCPITNFKNNYIMKKIILLLLLVLVSITASARKSYITVYTYYNDGQNTNTYTNIRMTGDVPNNIEGFRYYEQNGCYNAHYDATTRMYNVGEILNLLSSEYGYEVEFVDNDFHCFLLSKEIPSGQTISKGDVNTDGEVNIADVNEVIGLILGYVKEHPEILEQIRK